MEPHTALSARARTHLGLVACSVILFFIGIYATFYKAPRYLEIVADKTHSDKVTLLLNGSVTELRPAERLRTYTNHTLEIENLGSNGADAWISFIPTYLDNSIAVDLTSFQKSTGDWGIDSRLQRYTSSKVSSIAIWRGFGAGLALAVTTSTANVKLRVSWNGKSKIIHIKNPDVWKVVKLPSRSSSLYLPLSAGCSNLTVLHPSGRLYLRDGASRQLLGKSKEAITIPTTRWPGKALAFFGSAVILLIAFFVTGFPLVLLCAPLLQATEALPLAFFAGYSILNLPIASLALVGVPTFAHSQTISLVALGISVVSSVVVIAKHPQVLWGFARNMLSLEALLAYSIALGATLFVFSPSAVKGEWFLGQALTDTFYYSNWSAIYSQILPHQHVGEGLYSMRIADLSATKIASDLLGSDTLRAQGPHAAALWMAFSLCAWLIVARLSKSLLIRVGGTWLLSINPTTYALFSESYTAQFIFIALLAGAIAATSLFTRSHALTTSSAPLVSKSDCLVALLVSPIFAMAASIYPYHFALPAACVLASLTEALRRNIFPLKRTILIGLLSALLVNTQFLVLLRFSDTSHFMARLNDIARHIVFPYFNTLTVFGVLAGIRDHFLFGQTLGGTDTSAFTSIITSIDAALTCAILCLCSLGLVRSLLSRDFFKTTLGIHASLLGGIAVFLYINDQPYAFGKMILSIGFPMVMLAIFGVECFVSKYGVVARCIASTLLVYWIARSAVSIIAMNVPPILPPQLTTVRNVRSHVDELPEDIQHIRPLLASVDGRLNRKIAVIGQPGSLKGTDGDRVIIFAIWHQLVGSEQYYFPTPLLGGNAHTKSYRVIPDRFALERQLLDGDFELVIVMNDELGLLPLTRYKLSFKGERFSLFTKKT